MQRTSIPTTTTTASNIFIRNIKNNGGRNVVVQRVGHQGEGVIEMCDVDTEEAEQLLEKPRC